MQKGYILAGVFLLSILIAGCSAEEEQLSAEEALNELSLAFPAAKEFSVESYFLDEREHATKLTLVRGDDVLKIRTIQGIEKKSADVLIKEGIISINAIYGDALSPYPGEISDKIVCAEEFRPEFGEVSREIDYSYFTLFATERFTYGACVEDLVKYRAVLAWAYCEEAKTLHRFEFFTPLADFSDESFDLATSFSC
jgi:hypothetical protein